MERHLLAISGSGFSGEENAYIDQFLLKLCQKISPIKICFIATASDDAPEYIEKFYKQFQSEEPSPLSRDDLRLDNIQEIVNSFDIVYIGGGNTYRMMQIWKQAGFDHVIRNAYECGVIDGEKRGEKRGEARGEKRGINKGITKVAKSMVNENIDINIISKVTGLTKDQLVSLR